VNVFDFFGIYVRQMIERYGYFSQAQRINKPPVVTV
jgi:hypothetical protein